MIIFISASAILTVLATGLQFVGIFLPVWWGSVFTGPKGTKRGYYTFGLWYLPWKTEKCYNDICSEDKNEYIETPTWLVFTRLFELLGAGLGLITIVLLLAWLILLGPLHNKHLVLAKRLGNLSTFTQIFTGICINIGILILVIKTTPSDILVGTFLSGVSFIIFCIAGAISYHCVKQMPSSRERHQDSNDLSIIRPPVYDPPPSYEEIMGPHYQADNPAVIVVVDEASSK